ncbi:MAG: helix-turn-helix transcriptional regulator [Pseudosphingobacterium sp.]|nr:helix-turn-helix transcriptional regulator [Pseudosphingobacterium sp.]
MLVLQFQGELKIETSSGEPVIRMGEGSCAMLMMEEGKYYSLGEPGSTKTLLIGMNTAWFSDVFEGCKTFRDFIEESRNGGFRSLPLSGINNDVRRRVIPLLLLVPAKGGFLQNQLAEMIRAVVLTYLNLLQWPEEIWREELRKIKAYVLQSVLKEEKVPKIEELTTRYASSRHVFEKDCQKFTGLRPIELIAKIRLEEAYRLLQTTDKSVADVSHIVLYCSPSAFIKAFKKHYGGYTPGEARNALGIASFIR